MDSSSRKHIKIDHLHYITKYNKYMAGGDFLDALFSFYQINVHGKEWYWPHYINIVDILNSATFKAFKLVNPDAKMNFLAFPHWVAMNYVKITKLRSHLPTNIYPRKRFWKGKTAFPENERNQRSHFVEKCSQKQCRECSNRPRMLCLICKIGLCMEPCFKAFHMSL